MDLKKMFLINGGVEVDHSFEQYILHMPEISPTPIKTHVFIDTMNNYTATCNIIIMTRLYGGEFPCGEGMSSQEALQNLIKRIIYYYQENKERGFDIRYEELF